MGILLPSGVDYSREEQNSGTIVYVFKHRISGVLGSLTLLPDANGSRLSWQPSKENCHADHSLPHFVKNILTETQEIINNLRNRPKADQ